MIGDLLDSIRMQDYPAEKVHPFVIADNCSDNTADVALKHGAQVYTRHNTRKIGKGYALEKLLERIHQDHPEGYDAYLVFDADNLLKEDYLKRMNESLNEGNDIVTSYRNSKNYASNWISAGYALWFLRESRFLNHPRNLLHSSCSVSGTGFCFTREVCEELGGWPFHLLTEDIEFSVHEIIKGRKIAFCKDAELYDEQPVTFAQSCGSACAGPRAIFRSSGNTGRTCFSACVGDPSPASTCGTRSCRHLYCRSPRSSVTSLCPYTAESLGKTCGSL